MDRRPVFVYFVVRILHGAGANRLTPVFLLFIPEPFSLVLVGLETATKIGLTGALCVWVSVAIGIDRTRSNPAMRRSPYRSAQLVAVSRLVFAHASTGWFFSHHGTLGGRVSLHHRIHRMELLVEAGMGISAWVGGVVVVSSALNGVAILQAYFRIFTGSTHRTTIPLTTLRSERVAILAFTVLLIGAGLWPQPGVQSRYHAAVETA